MYPKPASLQPQSVPQCCDSLWSNPTGQAWIVPYGGFAQFQVGYKGLRDMATEGGKVRHLHVAEIFEGEYLEEDRFTGLYELKGQKMSDKVHTLLCFYQDIYGFKMIAHPIEKIHTHAKQYNPGGYNAKGSPWQSDKPRTVRQMEKKTIFRRDQRMGSVGPVPKRN